MGNQGSGTFVAVVSGLSTILLGWIGCATERQRIATDRMQAATDSAAKFSQVALAELSEERQRLAGQRDVNLKVYEAVASALQDGSARRQEIARSLVYAMVADTALQHGLLQALRQEGVPSVQAVVARDLAFDDSSRQARASVAGLRPHEGVSRVDLFWCESSGPAARQLMDEVRRLLIRRGFTEAGVRVRPLPETVNSRPGYNVTGFEVRFETTEQGAADQVQADIRTASSGKQTAALHRIAAQTPGYVSAFACPAR
jgi:hypothetical protein